MENRKKKTKVCDKRSSQGEDLISNLPDPLLYDILYHLPTEESVRTSVLSKRWRNIWQGVLKVDLDNKRFPSRYGYMGFINRWLDSDKKSSLRKLQVNTHTRFYEMPLSMYTCPTLVHLRLASTHLPTAEFVSLPCLKIMSLEYVKYLNRGTGTFEKLISGSPVLEDLTIFSGEYEHRVSSLQVRSQTLKRIEIGKHTKVVIDAPLLECLKTKINSTINFEIISPDFCGKLDVVYSRFGENVTRDILTRIPRIKDLTIRGDMWEDIFQYSTLGPLVRFCYLTHLNAQVPKSDLFMLPTVLECCPKLESLILEMVKEVETILDDDLLVEPMLMYSTVPQCLVSSLKFVALKSSISRNEREKELVRYLLKNSTLLEKVKLDLHFAEKGKRAFRKELDAMPKCSSICEVRLL